MAEYLPSLVIVALGICAVVAFVLWSRQKGRSSPDGYNWQPEQDYDVVMHGESPMTPGFPVLVRKRRTNGSANNKDQSQSNSGNPA